MQLPKSSGKGGLAALVRSRHDDSAFLAVEMKIVAHDRCTRFDELIGQRQIEAFAAPQLFACCGHLRVTEAQAGALQSSDIMEGGDVEVNFAIEGDDRVVGKVAVSGAIFAEIGKYFRIQLADIVQDLRLDMVHLQGGGKFHPIILGRYLLEFFKGALHLGAVVGLRFIFADREGVALDEDAISDIGKLGPKLFCVGDERGEAVGGDMPDQIAVEGRKAAGAKYGAAQIGGE